MKQTDRVFFQALASLSLLALSAGAVVGIAYAEPTLTILENNCSRYPEYLEVRWRVNGLPTTFEGFVLVLEMGDTERIVGGGASGTFELGYAEGSFLTPPTAPGPYTIIFHEDANLDTIPDEGGLQVSTTFTCPEPPGEEEPPLTEQFRNQGQCIAYSNSNPNSGITKEECQGAFTGNNGRNNNN